MDSGNISLDAMWKQAKEKYVMDLMDNPYQLPVHIRERPVKIEVPIEHYYKVVRTYGGHGLEDKQVGPLFNNENIANNWVDLDVIKTGNLANSYKVLTCKFNEEEKINE